MSTSVATAPRDSRRLARAAQIFVALFALLDPLRPTLLTGAEQGERGDLYVRYLQISTTVGLVAIIVFVLWFRRCRHNAELLSPGSFTYSPGWAVGAWFTPVLMFWRPRRIALDIHRVLTHGSAPDNTVTLINAWWAAWIGHTAAGLLATSADNTASLPLSITAQALYPIAAVLVIVVIQRFTTAQTHPQPHKPSAPA
ncbi:MULTISPECIES: DUF4328 domain-containing protein [unclassified Streptomyces]|uniref:DUF4328 domain-containing protein n=1 Tax=unclassified Streptomyces TaxID=2593676 RepID=UPI00081F2129|nr:MULTISPECIES: DUF4328 domain-containing protein [unclassified Streptomyces]MYZ36357.1 DUF4328 domain-containing protein [Streptomyces sp. SID4917]SCF82923.1 protein of unknown function [Streptomyces sp. MnatMP-M17]